MVGSGESSLQWRNLPKEVHNYYLNQPAFLRRKPPSHRAWWELRISAFVRDTYGCVRSCVMKSELLKMRKMSLRLWHCKELFRAIQLASWEEHRKTKDIVCEYDILMWMKCDCKSNLLTRGALQFSFGKTHPPRTFIASCTVMLNSGNSGAWRRFTQFSTCTSVWHQLCFDWLRGRRHTVTSVVVSSSVHWKPKAWDQENIWVL